MLPSDPGSVADTGVILDDHHPHRIRCGPTGELTKLYYPAINYLVDRRTPVDGPGNGYVRALIRSDNGCKHARLLEVTVTPDGVTYSVVAERPDCDLDEFVVSDDQSTMALLWNMQGRSELQIPEHTDYTPDRAHRTARRGRRRAVHQCGRLDGRDDRRRARRCPGPSSSSTRGPVGGNSSTANPPPARWFRVLGTDGAVGNPDA